MTNYKEVLRPSIWTYVAALFILPMVVLVCAPFDLMIGIVLAIVLYAIVIGIIVFTAPTIELTETELRVGRAHIGREYVGQATGYAGSHAVAERGVNLNANAYVMFRGMINPVVKVDINDPEDPTPYWLFSTRHPEKLVSALSKN